MQIYRDQYGEAMLVPLRGTPTCGPQINENIWNSLLLWERLLFPRELVYIHIKTSPNTWTVQTAKSHKKIILFQTNQFCDCDGAVLRSRREEISKIQDAVL